LEELTILFPTGLKVLGILGNIENEGNGDGVTHVALEYLQKACACGEFPDLEQVHISPWLVEGWSYDSVRSEGQEAARARIGTWNEIGDSFRELGVSFTESPSRWDYDGDSDDYSDEDYPFVDFEGYSSET